MKKKLLIVFLIAVIVVISGTALFKPHLISKIKYKIANTYNQKIRRKTISNNYVGKTYGIDVSHHQGNINWNKVKEWNNKKIEFVYIKATEGATYIDKTYLNNISKAKNNNLLVGSYHYFRTTSSVKDQLKNFMATVDKNQQDLIPLIDVEERKNWNTEEFHQNFKAFLNGVEAYYGKKPMIYTVNSFYNLHLAGKYKEYHFLIGRYGKNSPNMRDKTNWTIWQFSETGKIEGISKPVDIDVLNNKFTLQDILL